MPLFIPESGGWLFGRVDGSHLDLIPSHPSGWRPGWPKTLREQLEELATRMISHLLFPVPQDRLPTPTLLPRMSSWGLITGDGAYVLRLNLPKGISLLDALYQIEKAEDGLPAFLLAPFVRMALRRPGQEENPEEEAVRMGLLVLLVHRHEGGRSGRARPMDRAAQRDALIRRVWQSPSRESGLDAIGALPLSGTDLARAVLEAGEALWTETGIPAEDPTPAGFLIAFQMARLVMLSPGRDWGVWWETVRARRAGRSGPPSDWPSLRATYTIGLQVLAGSEPPADADLARGLWHALAARAQAEGRYRPSGRFRVRAPDLPLFRRAGVTALRVAADPHGLWVQLMGERGPGEIFRFDQEMPPRPDLAADPAWVAAAAALWHDLVVGIPARSRHGAGEDRQAEHLSEKRDQPVPSSGSQPLVLPRPFRISASPGKDREPEAEWGEPKELEHLRRAAHMVRGHLRRLPPGWSASAEARELAEIFGVILPEGYTFVRPHLRGDRGEGSDLPLEREAVARGLRSLALLG